ncbi:uncharacterized protein N7483_001807 [Penicillium malachiteum]|uniref:uncharacterized protein n=1 Tax=Penicillium malachiteum TaxID=1324776 RepID=UPI002547958E|nr:uncharacterized protein N7483_001807 [Penicillium malachiteum]KAJ5736682.1 hypothetical protein N7483_001807 [Penicillium malachiteum]
MGNLQSTQTKEETRRSNRLSKPLTKKLALSSPQISREEYEESELTSGLIGWENPWVGSKISELKRFPSTKAREISIPFRSKSKKTKHDSAATDPLPLTSSLASSVPVKRASQPVVSTTPQLSAAHHPRRANSVQLGLQRSESVIYENPMEDAASSNTHFLVGNQRFSLTRRRSLLTRPGVATRRTTGAIRRVPSPIGEPEMNDSESTMLNWSLPPRQRPPLGLTLPHRPTSPADAQYTQLGALKLGSLRVVNGSASPCPSERIPLDRSTVGKGLGLENVKTMCPKTTVQIPVVSDIKKSDDLPASPFSFEKSPIISVPSRGKAVFTTEPEENKMIIVEDVTQLEKSAAEVVLDKATASRSLSKSDSGYSSATSLRSIHRSRTRNSVDSQLSISQVTEDKFHRHLSLQEEMKPGNYSRPNPTSTRWYDGNGPNTQRRLGIRRSTLCAPRYSEYPTQNDLVPATTEYPFIYQKEETISSRGPLYADRCSTYSSSSSTTMERITSSSQSSSKTRSQVRRSSSEHYFNRAEKLDSAPSSRSRSRTSGRNWSQRPGIEAPPLPTILSPGHAPAAFEDAEEEYPLSHCRGRPRSRSQDYRRKLTKTHHQPNLHMTASTFALR